MESEAPKVLLSLGVGYISLLLHFTAQSKIHNQLPFKGNILIIYFYKTNHLKQSFILLTNLPFGQGSVGTTHLCSTRCQPDS